MSLSSLQQRLLAPCAAQRANKQPFSIDAKRHSSKPRRDVKTGSEKKEGGGNGDTLTDRLKAAEAEAEVLRQQLAAAKAAQEQKGGTETAEAPKKRTSRIDGAGLQRETLFSQGAGDWLSESNFFKGTMGPGELSSGAAGSPEDAAVVRRRLIIGGVATAVIAALSLLPTDSLRLSRPSKPLFFYLTPLVRVQGLLKDLETAAAEGQTEDLQQGIARIQGAPNFAVENLRNAAAALPDSRSAEKAGVVARDVIEYLDSIDYNKYFESMQKPSARSGDVQKMFVDFSLNSIRAAQVKLKLFFSLMPAEQMEAARQQANAL